MIMKITPRTGNAIVTKYHVKSTGAGRISATDNEGNRVYIPYPHELSEHDKHFAAVQKLCEKMEWHGTLYCGWLRGTTRVWVWKDDELEYTV